MYDAQGFQDKTAVMWHQPTLKQIAKCYTGVYVYLMYVHIAVLSCLLQLW